MIRKISVLLVDDDPLLRRLVAEQLSRSGFEMATAVSGEEAIEALQATGYDGVVLGRRVCCGGAGRSWVRGRGSRWGRLGGARRPSRRCRRRTTMSCCSTCA